MLGDAGADPVMTPHGADLDAAELWGERAQQLLEFVKKHKPAVVSRNKVCVWAAQHGWLEPTREGVIGYAVETKQLVAYQAFSGPAYKIPFTPVFDADDDVASKPPTIARPVAVKAPPASPHVDMLDPPKENAVAKDWISTKEAAELLGMTDQGTRKAAKRGDVEFKIDGTGERAPMLFNRASVIAFRASHKKGERKARPATAVESPRGGAVVSDKPKPAPSPSPAPPAVTSDLAADVRALLRNLERGWMTNEDVVRHLAELVA